MTPRNGTSPATRDGLAAWDWEQVAAIYRAQNPDDPRGMTRWQAITLHRQAVRKLIPLLAPHLADTAAELYP